MTLKSNLLDGQLQKWFEWRGQYSFDPTSHLRWTSQNHQLRMKLQLFGIAGNWKITKSNWSAKFFLTYRNVIHHFVVSTRNVNLLDGSRGKFVHKFAQKNSITKWVFESFTCEGFAGDSNNPFLCFLFLLLVALSSNLK